METIRRLLHPTASRMPISWVRSNTVMSMVFMTPSTPTMMASSEVLQLMARATRNPWLVPTTSLATIARPSGNITLTSSQQQGHLVLRGIGRDPDVHEN